MYRSDYINFDFFIVNKCPIGYKHPDFCSYISTKCNAANSRLKGTWEPTAKPPFPLRHFRSPFSTEF